MESPPPPVMPRLAQAVSLLPAAAATLVGLALLDDPCLGEALFAMGADGGCSRLQVCTHEKKRIHS